MLLEVFLGVIAAILLVFLWWTGQTVKYKSIAHIPGPAPLPIMGNCLLFRHFNEVVPKLMKLCNKYGSVFRLWLGSTPLLIVTDPEMTEFILRSPTYTSKGYMYRFIKPWLKNTMLTSTGDTWQIQKKTISHSMNINIMENYRSIFNSACDILVEILSAKADGNTCNIAPLMFSYTLDVIVESVMGAKLNTQRQPNNEYAKAIHFMTDIIIKRNLSIWKRFDFLFMFTKDYRDQKVACKILHDFATRIIEERRQSLQTKKGDKGIDGNAKKMTLYVDILLNATINGKPLPEQQIREDLSAFIFAVNYDNSIFWTINRTTILSLFSFLNGAFYGPKNTGHDTTAAVLQFLFYELSNNQEVQNKIVDELKEIFGNDKNRPCTMEDTSKMQYMERVIKESMRCNAPVPFTARTLEEDVHYKNTILPKGLNILFFIYGLHRNPDMYDDPDVFDLDRFISEDAIKPYSYLPFSAGSRSCKGQKYALIKLKVTVAKLLRNFEFLPAGPGNELKLLTSMVLKTSNGINVRIKRRDF